LSSNSTCYPQWKGRQARWQLQHLFRCRQTVNYYQPFLSQHLKYSDIKGHVTLRTDHTCWQQFKRGWTCWQLQHFLGCRQTARCCQTAGMLPWPDWPLLHHLLGCRQTAGCCQTAGLLPWPDWRLLRHLLGCRQTAGIARRLWCCPGRIGDYCTISSDADRLRGLPDGWRAALAGLATTALPPPGCRQNAGVARRMWCCSGRECKLKSSAFMKEEALCYAWGKSIEKCFCSTLLCFIYFIVRLVICMWNECCLPVFKHSFFCFVLPFWMEIRHCCL